MVLGEPKRSEDIKTESSALPAGKKSAGKNPSGRSNKKIPLRRCVGCGESKPKKELIRVVRTPEADIILDPTGKKSGRGAYVCRDKACLRKAMKSKRLERSLETAIPAEVCESLERELEKSDENREE